MYRDTTSKVRVNDLYTDEFPVLSGVKQGCNLSPTLFAVYINDLAEEIKASGIGVHYDDDVIGILLYADDVVLLAESEKDLQTLLDILDRWCRRWRLLVNCDKTKIVHFRPPSIQRSRSDFTYGDLTISFTDKYKYLGLWFNEHINMQFAVSELVKSASRALGALHAKFSYAGGMSFEVYDKLYKALVQPVMYYGSAIWGTCKYPKLDSLQAKAGRFYLGVRKHTANIAVRGEMGWLSNTANIRLEVIRYWNKLCTSNNDRLISKIHRWSLGKNRSWEGRVLSILREIT